MGRQMGLDILGGSVSGAQGQSREGNACFKMKFRWMMTIDGVAGTKNSGSSSEGVFVLPPLKSARPSLGFKEMEVKHVNETIYFPTRPEWKPINLTLYDLKGDNHPVWDWIKSIYDPDQGFFFPTINFGSSGAESSFKKNVNLCLLDGCGTTMEKWKFENAWPQNIEFGDLDMSDSGFVTADIALRYDRAFLVEGN